MGFPVTINGITFEYSDFFPLGYVDALPDSIEAMGDEYKKNANGTSSTSLTISAGSKSFTTQTNLSWVANETLVAMANSGSNMMRGQITAYTPSTGAAQISVSEIVGSGTFSSWIISELASLDGYSEKLLLSYERGGIGKVEHVVTDIDNDGTAQARAAHMIPMPEDGMCSIFDDFVNHMVVSENKMGPWLFRSNNPYTNLLLDDTIIQELATSSANGVVGIYAFTGYQSVMSYGSGGFISVSEGGDFLFVTQLRLYSASSPTDRYVVRAGLRGTSSTGIAGIFDGCGIGFEYSDSINSGAWTCVCNPGGTGLSYNKAAYPGITVSEGVVYTLYVYGDKKTNTVKFYVAESATGIVDFYNTDYDNWPVSISIDKWPVGNLSHVHPAFSISKTNGLATPVVYFDYVWASKITAGGR